MLLSRFLSLLAVVRGYLYACLLCAPSQRIGLLVKIFASATIVLGALSEFSSTSKNCMLCASSQVITLVITFRCSLACALLCETLQLQESLVVTVRCCQAGTLPCSCAWLRFLIFAHGRWLVFFARKEFGQQGRCVHLHNLQECLMIEFSCRSFFLLELLAGREFWHQGCVHLHSWQDLTVIVSRVPQHCASLPVGSALGFLPFESRASRVFLF